MNKIYFLGQIGMQQQSQVAKESLVEAKLPDAPISFFRFTTIEGLFGSNDKYNVSATYSKKDGNDIQKIEGFKIFPKNDNAHPILDCKFDDRSNLASMSYDATKFKITATGNFIYSENGDFLTPTKSLLGDLKKESEAPIFKNTSTNSIKVKKDILIKNGDENIPLNGIEYSDFAVIFNNLRNAGYTENTRSEGQIFYDAQGNKFWWQTTIFTDRNGNTAFEAKTYNFGYNDINSGVYQTKSLVTEIIYNSELVTFQKNQDNTVNLIIDGAIIKKNIETSEGNQIEQPDKSRGAVFPKQRGNILKELQTEGIAFEMLEHKPLGEATQTPTSPTYKSTGVGAKKAGWVLGEEV